MVFPPLWLRKKREDVILIEVTRLNGKKVLVNAEKIETVEATPDTVITLDTGKKIIVKEGCQDVKNLVLSYKRDIVVKWTNIMSD